MPLPWSLRCTARSCAAGCNGRATPSRSQLLIARSYCKVRDSTSSARVLPNPFPHGPVFSARPLLTTTPPSCATVWAIHRLQAGAIAGVGGTRDRRAAEPQVLADGVALDGDRSRHATAQPRASGPADRLRVRGRDASAQAPPAPSQVCGAHGPVRSRSSASRTRIPGVSP